MPRTSTLLLSFDVNSGQSENPGQSRNSGQSENLGQTGNSQRNEVMLKISASLRKNWPALLSAAIILAAWQLAANRINMGHILPGPVQIIKRTWELRESLFLHHLPSTLETVLCGWVLSTAIGIILAVIMHISKRAEAMLYPLLVITQTVPVMCISPLFVLWLGYTMGARLIAVVLSTFFAITLNTFSGLESADIRKKELMRTYGASPLQIFLKLEVPSAFPELMTALKLTMPWAVIDAAVAEWLGATQGLGYFSKRMITKMDGAAVFAPILVLSVMALIGMRIMKLIDEHFVKYRNEI